MLDDGAGIPSELLSRIPTRDGLLDHRVEVDRSRWQLLSSSRGLPPPAGPLLGVGPVSIARGDVLRTADAAISMDSAVQLFYASMAWGLGKKARNLHRRLQALSSEATRQRLADAWEAVREGRSPVDCYEMLIDPKGRGRIYYLGPAFASKYLYFATGTTAAPRCLILDGVVARKLRPLVWPNAPTAGWWPATYGRYCALLERWAVEQSLLGRPTQPDQIEMALFRL